jgi:hypothetical protein
MKITVCILSIGSGIVLAMFAFKETTLLQILTLAALLGLVTAFVVAVINAVLFWRQRRWRVLFPFLVVLLCGVGGPRLGGVVRNAYFRKQLPDLETAIASYRDTGTMPDTQWRGYQVHADEWEGATVVEFWWGSGFPVKHTVLLYFSGDDITSYRRRHGWYYASRLEEHWWIVRD